MVFFDFVYYRIYRAYSKARDSSPGFMAICIASLVQAASIVVIVDLYSLFTETKLMLSDIIWIVLVLLIIFINYARYLPNRGNNYEIIKKKWELLSIETQRRKRFLIILYIWGILILAIGLSIYLGDKKM